MIFCNSHVPLSLTQWEYCEKRLKEASDSTPVKLYGPICRDFAWRMHCLEDPLQVMSLLVTLGWEQIKRSSQLRTVGKHLVDIPQFSYYGCSVIKVIKFIKVKYDVITTIKYIIYSLEVSLFNVIRQQVDAFSPFRHIAQLWGSGKVYSLMVAHGNARFLPSQRFESCNKVG
jgi:hypothetical protein